MRSYSLSVAELCSMPGSNESSQMMMFSIEEDKTHNQSIIQFLWLGSVLFCLILREEPNDLCEI
jgi:hypothetical protein